MMKKISISKKWKNFDEQVIKVIKIYKKNQFMN